MLITTLFRTILIVGLGSTLVSIIASMTLIDTLPLILQEYLTQVENEDMSTNIAILLSVSLSVLILLIISTIGLWKFKNWARVIYITLVVIFFPFYLINGAIVMNPLEAMFNDISFILEGILISLMFFNPKINEKFNLKS